MRQLSIEQAQQEFYSIIESGETVIIERDGVPVAQFAPLPMTSEFRKEVLEELAAIIVEGHSEPGAPGSRS